MTAPVADAVRLVERTMAEWASTFLFGKRRSIRSEDEAFQSAVHRLLTALAAPRCPTPYQGQAPDAEVCYWCGGDRASHAAPDSAPAAEGDEVEHYRKLLNGVRETLEHMTEAEGDPEWYRGVAAIAYVRSNPSQRNLSAAPAAEAGRYRYDRACVDGHAEVGYTGAACPMCVVLKSLAAPPLPATKGECGCSSTHAKCESFVAYPTDSGRCARCGHYCHAPAGRCE